MYLNRILGDERIDSHGGVRGTHHGGLVHRLDGHGALAPRRRQHAARVRGDRACRGLRVEESELSLTVPLQHTDTGKR